jgi:hypothetical protein
MKSCEKRKCHKFPTQGHKRKIGNISEKDNWYRNDKIKNENKDKNVLLFEMPEWIWNEFTVGFSFS